MEQNKIPGPLNISRIPSLDGLRAISIAIVIFSHILYEMKWVELADVPQLGATGVEIFFVISGFLITTLLLKEKMLKGRISLKNFYIRRAFRILPLVFLFLFTVFFLNRIFQLGVSNRSFLTAVFFLKNLPFPNGSEWYTGHFWSLAIEEQFYIIFPWLVAYLSMKNYKKLVIGLIFFLTIVNFCFYNEIGLFYSNRLIHITSAVIVNLFSVGTISILVGSFLSVWMFENPDFFNKLVNIKSLVLSSVLFLIALVLRIPFFHLYIPYITNPLYAFMIGMVIIMNINETNVMARVLNLTFMAEIGVLSYSLYVWQQLFTHQQPWRGMFKYSDSIILNLIGLFLVAYLSYRFFEKKFLDLKDRFKMVK